MRIHIYVSNKNDKNENIYFGADLAYELIGRNNDLATLKPPAADHVQSALRTLSYKSKTFCVDDDFNCCQELVYRSEYLTLLFLLLFHYQMHCKFYTQATARLTL